ncbi:hypothetical protein J2R99_000039 [Rhodopseudomonas julia]|uniref:Uncharacterized protein n=1 Tax=Rhodopseudomonas julia TaxID=200617 RepID=A0ABU0C118_9BRAD|nr:hypothetical protein [Rhodopseudomonas julia]MDQ0324190.1 hypothetical protein [Rhodopseudomonas julia]
MVQDDQGRQMRLGENGSEAGKESQDNECDEGEPTFPSASIPVGGF